MENPKEVSFAVLESVCVRLERNNLRLFVLCIVLLLALIATNAGWIWYESQYQVVSYEQEVTQSATDTGNNTFVGGDMNGTADGQDND